MSKTIQELEFENKMLRTAVKDAVNSLDALYIAISTETLIHSDLEDARHASIKIRKEYSIDSSYKKPTGVDFIAQERQEQIEKHNKSLKDDLYFNSGFQLAVAAEMLLASEHEEGIDSESYPENWNHEVCMHMLSKPYKQKLIIAGALIAAEIDRLNA